MGLMKFIEMKEVDLAKALGVGRDVLKGYRDRGEVEEGRDWRRAENSRPRKLWPVVWTPYGIGVLRGKLGFGDEYVEEVVRVAQEEKVEKDGRVVAVFRNPRLVACDIPVSSDGKKKERVNVLVRDNSKFLVGMVVPLRRDGVRWVASRHPRFPGKL